MKRFLSLVAILMVTVVTAQVAEAKKFGGGRSFGKSFKTAPAPKQQNMNTNSIGKNQAGKAQGSSKKGLMGGILGGLLAGGLLAAMFGGAFDGIQFMDILILGVIAFIIFKLVRGMLGAKQGSINQHRQQPAYGGAHEPKTEPVNERNFEQAGGGNTSTGQFGSVNDVPHNFPPGFDQVSFVDGAREHYRILQGAWNFNQLDKIEEYVSASLFADLKEERAKLQGEQHTDVMYVDAEIVRAEFDAQKAQISLQFSGRYKDPVENVEEDIKDLWHLERDLTTPNAPWLIVGIQG
ncbi:TIM44-like domain-containing protein [Vibrio sp. S4M6]|uniref:Tim44 domain-containing protein n=1 Tax=Vibrio sinus TaxID=2946865 RepID=UPI00202A535A|nr:TIM44-like domain-containing protein [Vibrio sinus]MCL9783088.1 TIM44-like domain-containing protein [Vibrio sinus]